MKDAIAINFKYSTKLPRRRTGARTRAASCDREDSPGCTMRAGTSRIRSRRRRGAEAHVELQNSGDGGRTGRIGASSLPAATTNPWSPRALPVAWTNCTWRIQIRGALAEQYGYWLFPT